LLIHEVTAHHGVLRILPVAGERPEPVDRAFRLFGFLLPVGQRTQSRQELLFLLSRLLPALLEALLAGARLEVRDVSEEDGHEHRGSLAPTRPRDIDLASAAHTVFVEPA